ncbi:MAG: hypothetical protein PF572_04210 [Patescibacteria group bacterium]|jgi:hypothetical protein|nr:hypothetical protein [Patescibacteria group bacterium]
MSNKLQTTIIIAFAVISFSIFYSLVINPLQREKKLNDCLSKTYDNGQNFKLQWGWADMCVKQYK